MGGLVTKSASALLMITAVLIAAALPLLFLTPVTAASITTASDILERSQTSTLSNHEIKFVTPTGVAAGQTITLTFESGFSMGTFSVNNWDFATGSSNNCTTASFTEQNLAATPSGSTWGIAQSSQVVTLTSGTGTVTADRCVRFRVGTNATHQATGTRQITNPSSAGDYTVTIGGSFGDTGTIAVNIIADDTIDVTATVETSIACTVNNTATDFGTFTVATVATASPTVTWTISTNAASGYNLTVRDEGNGTNPGLYSSGANYLIGSADNSFNDTANLSSVSIGYGLQGTKTDGDTGSATTTIDSRYNQTSNNVGGFERTATALASATGPVANATVTSTLKAKVSGLVPAGSYVDYLTYICTGVY